MSAEVESRQVERFKYELQQMIDWDPPGDPRPAYSLYLLTDSNGNDNFQQGLKSDKMPSCCSFLQCKLISKKIKIPRPYSLTL